MPTLIEVKNYLRIYFDDDDTLLNTLIKVAEEYLIGAVGNFDETSERAKMLALIVIDDLYSQRGINEKVSGNIRKLVSDFSLQLKIESVVDDAAI